MGRSYLCATLLVLGIHVAIGVAIGHAQLSQDGVNQNTRATLDSLSHRIDTLEPDHVKVAVLESDMTEVKWLVRGIAAAFGWYVFMVMVSARRQTPNSISDRRHDDT